MKKTKILKSLVIALTFLFTMALTFGITVAAYNTSRTADGTLTMDNGIVINYTGFGKVQDGEWENEQTTTFKLFANRDILPGDTINLNPAAIQKGSNSVDYYVRIKFEYKFYDALNADITSQIADYSAFLSTPTFNSAWVNGNNDDGWFYYATGTTLNALPTSYVNIFDGAQSINVALNADGFNHQGGGYKYSEQITITKIEATLTLEALQTTGSTWEIKPLVQNSNSQVVEIYSNEITLGNVGGAYKLGTGEAGTLSYDTTTLGTTLKIVVAGDSQINANAFNGSDLEEVYIGDQDYINGVSSYAAKIYSTPATFIIGANAFAGCTNLTIYLSSSCNYTIYTNAIPSTATVYYNGSTVSLPSAAGSVGGTNITMATPSIVTGGGSGAGGSGSVAVSSDSSLGDYLYTDASGLKWYFNLINNGASAELTKCRTSADANPTGSISIPSLVSSSELAGNISVTSIGHSAFSNCTGLTSVTIPSSVTSIEWYAFFYCSGLTSVTIPSSVTSIGGDAFHHCTGLTSVTIPNSVTSIGQGAFYSCTGLTSITIPDLVTSIGSMAFQGCTGLTSVTIGSSVTSIGGNAFRGCTGLTSVTIPNFVTSIDIDAFYDCTGLTSVTIGSSVTSIWSGAFSGCTGLTSFSGGNSKYQVIDGGKCLVKVDGNNQELIAFAPAGLASYTIPNSVTSIVASAFKGCTGLTSVTIGSSVTSIGESAFRGCTGLTSVTIGSSVTSIDSGAFSGCTGLTSVTIPNSVTNIEISAFGFCFSLTSVTFEGEGRTQNLDIRSGAFMGCSNLATVNFDNWPSGVNVTVENDAFNGCAPGLVVNIPNQ